MAAKGLGGAWPQKGLELSVAERPAPGVAGNDARLPMAD